MSDNRIRVEVARQLRADSVTLGDILSQSDAVERDVSKLRRHYVLVVSGMSSNGDWVNRIRRDHRFTQDEVEFINIRSDGIGLFRLFSRWFLNNVRFSIARQILNKLVEIIQKEPGAPISIICHSFGTDLVADALKYVNFEFHSIFLLGSICKTQKLPQLESRCSNLHNDTGSHDQFCILAAIIAPWFYEASGTFGFRESYATELCFLHDHDSCSEADHIFSAVVPRLKMMELPTSIMAESSFSFPAYNLSRRLFYFFIVIFPITLTLTLILPLPFWAIIASLFALIFGMTIPAYYFLKQPVLKLIFGRTRLRTP